MDTLQDTKYVILQAVALLQPTLPLAKESQQAELLDLDSVTYHQKIQWKKQFATAHDFCKGSTEHFFTKEELVNANFTGKGNCDTHDPIRIKKMQELAVALYCMSSSEKSSVSKACMDSMQARVRTLRKTISGRRLLRK